MESPSFHTVLGCFLLFALFWSSSIATYILQALEQLINFCLCLSFLMCQTGARNSVILQHCGKIWMMSCRWRHYLECTASPLRTQKSSGGRDCDWCLYSYLLHRPRSGGPWFEASPGKNLAKPHLNQQARCGWVNISGPSYAGRLR
jgi:hypothetical protein